jgi:hypothetical protein
MTGPASRPVNMAEWEQGIVMKTVFLFVLAGALLGIAIASLVVPPALSWYSAPGGLPEGTQIQALVQIPEVIRYATGKLIRGQAIGAAIGAIAGLVAAFLLRNKTGVTATAGTVTPA